MKEGLEPSQKTQTCRTTLFKSGRSYRRTLQEHNARGNFADFQAFCTSKYSYLSMFSSLSERIGRPPPFDGTAESDNTIRTIQISFLMQCLWRYMSVAGGKNKAGLSSINESLCSLLQCFQLLVGVLFLGGGGAETLKRVTMTRDIPPPLRRRSVTRFSAMRLVVFLVDSLKICETFCRRKGAVVYGLQYGNEVQSRVTGCSAD